MELWTVNWNWNWFGGTGTGTELEEGIGTGTVNGTAKIVERLMPWKFLLHGCLELQNSFLFRFPVKKRANMCFSKEMSEGPSEFSPDRWTTDPDIRPTFNPSLLFSQQEQAAPFVSSNRPTPLLRLLLPRRSKVSKPLSPPRGMIFWQAANFLAAPGEPNYPTYYVAKKLLLGNTCKNTLLVPLVLLVPFSNQYFIRTHM